MKFTDEELQYLTSGDPLYPSDNETVSRLFREKELYLRSIGATEYDILTGCNLIPEEFWWYACDVVASLANELLEERSKKYNHLMSYINDLERDINQLRNEIKKI